MAERPLPVRRISFAYPDDMDPAWAPHLPAFAAAANAVSLGMPYAEPLFIRAVRSVMDELDDDLRARTETYIKQEVGHYTQHKRFNDIVSAHYPATVRLQRWMQRATDWVDRRSRRFRVAYAAGGETISYGVARWTDRNLAMLMDRARPEAATLYLWHLAEEIEHKSSTFDVFEATDGSRLWYSVATTVAVVSISAYTIIGMFMQLWHDKRLRHPTTWFQMIRLGVSLAFTLLPTLVSSAMPSHHPRQFADPLYLPMFLRQYDPQTGTMPLYGSLPSAA